MNSGWPSQRFSEAPLLDGRHDGGVEADAGVEAEEPPVHPAEPDRAEVAGVDAAGQQLGRGDRVVGQADRAGEHVGRPAGQDAERGVGAGDAGGDLVQRAVAAEADDDVDARAGRRRGRSGWRGRAGSSRRARRRGPRLSRRCTTTVLRAVTDDANEFTTSRIRKAPTVPTARRTGWQALGGEPQPVGNNERP